MVAGRGSMPRPRKGGRERSDRWKGETRSGFPLQVDSGVDVQDLDGAAVRHVEEPRFTVQGHVIPAAFAAEHVFLEQVIPSRLLHLCDCKAYHRHG